MEMFVTIIKLTTSILSGAGITTIVSGAVSKVTPDNMNKWQKITTVVASGVLGSMLASKADAYIDEKVDELYELAQDITGFQE